MESFITVFVPHKIETEQFWILENFNEKFGENLKNILICNILKLLLDRGRGILQKG